MAAIVCPKCGKLTDGKARACAYCGVGLGSTFRLDTWVKRVLGTSDATRLLLYLIVLIYILVGVVSTIYPSEGQRPGVVMQDFFMPEREVLIAMGMQRNEYITGLGEWWRLVTSVFIHHHLVHLVFNAMALFYVGFLVEGIFGKARALVIFFSAGVVGSVASYWAGINGGGSSGAIFGYLGALAWFGYRRGGVFGREIMKKMLLWAAYCTILGLMISRVNHLAHWSGFGGGVLAAMILGWSPSRFARTRNLAVGICALVFLASWIMVLIRFRSHLQ